MDPSPENIANYLSQVFGEAVSIHEMGPLRGSADDLKEYGYGTPIRIDFKTASRRGTVVLHTMRPTPFGHERMSDRAREMLWEHCAFNRLPKHIRALDVGGILKNETLVTLGKVDEFCLLTDYAEGCEYAADLERIRDSGVASDTDIVRADALCDYLAQIHKLRVNDPQAYLRRNRELVGDHECIMGIADSYPSNSTVTPQELEQIEQLCVAWRWKLKRRTHRLRQAHGDFHPWNILFRPDNDFTVLDRSRGEFGDPADDVTCLTMNYVFFSLQRAGRLEGAFEQLFRRFWDRYLQKTGDTEMLQVAAPFFAFRGLVMASPVWYPALAESVRSSIVRFILSVLNADSFDPALVNQYCGV